MYTEPRWQPWMPTSKIMHLLGGCISTWSSTTPRLVGQWTWDLPLSVSPELGLQVCNHASYLPSLLCLLFLVRNHVSRFECPSLSLSVWCYLELPASIVSPFINDWVQIIIYCWTKANQFPSLGVCSRMLHSAYQCFYITFHFSCCPWVSCLAFFRYPLLFSRAQNGITSVNIIMQT